jgi:hypothetical protein
MQNRLRRITDLFVEGRELVLGQEEDGTAILIWVNKPNSFEVEEARRDAAAARADRIMELKAPDNSELIALNDTLENWSTEEIVDARVNQKTDEHWFTAAQDIEADKDWRENLDYIQRMPQILSDANAADDDPRRERLAELNRQYLDETAKRMKTIQDEERRDLAKIDHADLREDFRAAWRERTSLDAYMAERRITEIYFCLRDCRAVRDSDKAVWDHSPCDGHQQRLLENRADVRGLPDTVVQAAIQLLDTLEVGQRTAGNSGAPVSSSASSEPQNAEAGSTPSTPTGTSPDATTT